MIELKFNIRFLETKTQSKKKSKTVTRLVLVHHLTKFQYLRFTDIQLKEVTKCIELGSHFLQKESHLEMLSTDNATILVVFLSRKCEEN